MPETVACPSCGRAVGVPEPRKTRLVSLEEPVAVCRCARCGFRYLNPRPTVDELALIYATDPYYAAGNATRGASRRSFYHARLDRLERWQPRSGRMLGIGCLEGGYFLGTAVERGWQVRAVEFSETMATHARTALGLDVTVTRAWDLGALVGERFDAVYSHSLEHVPDPRVTIQQCRQLLAPDGLLVLEVPNQFHSLVDVLKDVVIGVVGARAYPWFHRPVPFALHTVYFTPATIRRLLEQEGFEILAVRTHLRAHPLYLGKGWRRSLQGAIHSVGGLCGRGPCIEVIARQRGAATARPAAHRAGASGAAGPIDSDRPTQVH
jgi:2-polyprenyl-3-methyl-5-hydroxy-6-metoxy-1,4-benzoquinol methylase